MSIMYDFVEKFKETIKKGGIKSYIDEGYELSTESGLDVYCAAIYQGYLDTCRTFRSGKTLNKDDERIKELARLMKSYIDAPFGEKFDHNNYCNTLIGEGLMTYGQAQKIVNMAFKYLYCLVDIYEHGNTIEEKFDDCHIPLDGIMLTWIYRNILVDIGGKKSKMGTWSKMSYSDTDDDVDEEGHYTYNFYVKIINTYCEKEGKTPLQIDFENWREMSLILAAEEFIKVFDGNKIDKNPNLEALIDKIKIIVNNENISH